MQKKKEIVAKICPLSVLTKVDINFLILNKIPSIFLHSLRNPKFQIENMQYILYLNLVVSELFYEIFETTDSYLIFGTV